MKPWILLLISISLASPALGQTGKNVTKAVGKGVSRPRVSSVSRSAVRPIVRPPVTPAVPVSPGWVVASPVAATSSPALHQKLEEQLSAQLATRANLLQTQQALSFNSGFGKSVLYAPLEEPGKTGGFSVTVIEVEHGGQPEVFGVIASHVLPDSYYTYKESLKKDFHVTLTRPDGSEVRVAAHVVQTSPKSMLDISLVKFDPQYEALLEPLALSREPVTLQEHLFSYGYANGAMAQTPRTVQANSFLSVRTDQHIEGLRYGFCGSPLLDAQGHVKAIHTGTVEGKNGQADVSYGTHAGHIDLLVQAYHNNGLAVYNLEIDGQRIARLNVDEYISAVYIYDAQGKKLAQKNMEEKFSQSTLQKFIQENPSAAYVQLTSRKATWFEDDGWFILKEDRSKNDKTKRQHWYNLQTRQMEPQRPAVIK